MSGKADQVGTNRGEVVNEWRLRQNSSKQLSDEDGKVSEYEQEIHHN